ncbi:hypothetical protein [Algicella marina]|uniref:Uncharacterized protein n=1 Tax=Algicella marina TaxID=2683284 RepID=A0A6P1T287_9RHOB|nr:hypothetical protein [Algicella marina]QHQ34622.1 hypothetical protein GO499_05160 [Algicella marina]
MAGVLGLLLAGPVSAACDKELSEYKSARSTHVANAKDIYNVVVDAPRADHRVLNDARYRPPSDESLLGVYRVARTSLQLHSELVHVVRQLKVNVNPIFLKRRDAPEVLVRGAALSRCLARLQNVELKKLKTLHEKARPERAPLEASLHRSRERYMAGPNAKKIADGIGRQLAEIDTQIEQATDGVELERLEKRKLEMAGFGALTVELGAQAAVLEVKKDDIARELGEMVEVLVRFLSVGSILGANIDYRGALERFVAEQLRHELDFGLSIETGEK